MTPDQVAPEQTDDSSVRVRIRGRELSLAMTEEQVIRFKAVAQRTLHEPFTKRVWSELAFFLLGSALAGVGLAFVAMTMFAGIVLAITFFGLALLAFSLRIGRGIGGFERNLARIEDQVRARGWDVTVVEQYVPGNVRSASGGDTRLIRFAHGDVEWYSLMAHRALDLWKELEAETGTRLFEPVGIAWLASRADTGTWRRQAATCCGEPVLQPTFCARVRPVASATSSVM